MDKKNMHENKIALYRVSDLYAWRLETETMGEEFTTQKRTDSREIRLKVSNQVLSEFVGPRDLFNLLSQEASYKADLVEKGVRDYGSRFVTLKLRQKNIAEDGLVLSFEILTAKKNSFEFSMDSKSSHRNIHTEKTMVTSQFWI